MARKSALDQTEAPEEVAVVLDDKTRREFCVEACRGASICTHENCTITGIAGTTYVCPCHGSQYNSSGQHLAGPAPSNLRQFTVALSGDNLTITL